MAAPSAGLASSERGDTVARLRTANWLTTVGYGALVFVLVFVIGAQDRQLLDAVAAKEQSADEVAEMHRQLDCTAGLHARSDAALLAYLVALSSGDGAEVARVDAQQATNRWVEARERCS